MQDAFKLLGATPYDSSDRLRELFEEKQLLSDDDTQLNNAYTELTNVKKRIIHEIKFFSKEAFEDFDKIFIDNDEDEQEMVIEDICDSIIKVGKWFDSKTVSLYDTINETRKKSKFALVGNENIVDSAVDSLKEETMTSIKKYFDYWEQKDIVSLFNILVEQEDYMSFFIDDLLVHYENLIQESIHNKEKNCKQKFELLQDNSENFIKNGEIDEDFSSNITAFKKALNAWDKLVQPLQINYQKRGAEHPTSSEFVHDLRNKVIDMCNKSQEDLTGLLKNIQFDYSAKQTFMFKIGNSSEYISLLIKILDALLQVFKEIDVIAERLRNDKKDFEKIKESIEQMDNQISLYRPRTNSSSWQGNSSSYPRSSGSVGKGSSSNSKGKIIGWVVGIFIFIMIVVALISANEQNKTYYTVNLDSQGGYGGTSYVSVAEYDSMPSAIAPTKEGYDFVGYFSGKDGTGTKYYDSEMKSVRFWDYSYGFTLYADWTPKDGGIELNTGNFSTYFTLSSSCSVTRYDNYSSGTATYNFSISPKSSFNYSSNPKNPESIRVVIGLDITAMSYTYGATPSEYKIEVILYKSNGYSYSGTRTYTAAAYENYWDDAIYSVDTIIYK